MRFPGHGDLFDILSPRRQSFSLNRASTEIRRAPSERVTVKPGITVRSTSREAISSFDKEDPPNLMPTRPMSVSSKAHASRSQILKLLPAKKAHKNNKLSVVRRLKTHSSGTRSSSLPNRRVSFNSVTRSFRPQIPSALSTRLPEESPSSWEETMDGAHTMLSSVSVPTAVAADAASTTSSGTSLSGSTLTTASAPAQTSLAKNKLLLFNIGFVGGRSAYRCGEKVTGWVTVETRGPVHALSYHVECVGYSQLPAEQGSSSVPGTGRRLVARRHLAMQESLLSTSRLVEKRNFEFQLPQWLPHSVECQDLGCVRYYCRAVAAFSADDKAEDKVEVTRYFTVIEEVDLNAPAVAQRCTFDEVCSTSVDRLISKLLKDEIKTSLRLNKDAFVPGEDVKCHLSVHCSSSKVPVQRIVLRLVQRATAIGSNQRNLGRQSRVIVQDLITSEDGQESDRYWSARHRLHIPGVVATSLANSHFQHPIVVEYAVQMCVTIGFAHVPVKDLTLGCPILIGTVPKLMLGQRHALTMMDASFVEASNSPISQQQEQNQREKRLSKNGFLASLQSKRPDSGYRGPQLQYALYCVYYPTISLYRQKPTSCHAVCHRAGSGDGNCSDAGLKSILKVKHCNSLDDLDAKSNDKEQQQQRRRSEQQEQQTEQSQQDEQEQSKPQRQDHRQRRRSKGAGPRMKRSTSTGLYETPL